MGENRSCCLLAFHEQLRFLRRLPAIETKNPGIGGRRLPGLELLIKKLESVSRICNPRLAHGQYRRNKRRKR